MPCSRWGSIAARPTAGPSPCFTVTAVFYLGCDRCGGDACLSAPCRPRRGIPTHCRRERLAHVWCPHRAYRAHEPSAGHNRRVPAQAARHDRRAPPSPTVIANMEALGAEIFHVYGLTETYGPHSICAWHEEWDALPVDDARVRRPGRAYRISSLRRCAWSMTPCRTCRRTPRPWAR